MTFLSRHWALFIFAFVALSLFMAWQRLPAAAEAGIMSVPNGRRLLLRVLAFFGVVLGAQEAIVLTAGWATALCVYTRPASDPFVIAMLAVQFLASAWTIWWVWRGQGAFVLGRLGALLEGRADPPASIPPVRVRAFVTLIVAGGALVAALGLSGLWLWPTVDRDVCVVPARAAQLH